MESFDVLLASGAEHLGPRFKELGYRVLNLELNSDGKRFFPNSDVYVRVSGIESLSDRRVVVIQSCTGSTPAEEPYWTTADRVQELVLILETLRHPVKVEKTGFKEYSTTNLVPPSQIDVVLTFQPYALQDKAFKTGEAVSCEIATKQIASYCDRIWNVGPVVDAHYQWVSDLISSGVYKEIALIESLVMQAARSFGFDEYKVIAPDEGAQKRFGVPGLKKRRIDSYTIEMYGEVDVAGKNVILIDDLTKSGGTLLKAREMLLSQGALQVGIAVLHVMPVADRGEERFEELIEKSGGHIMVTNSVHTVAFCKKHPDLVHDIAEDIIAAIR